MLNRFITKVRAATNYAYEKTQTLATYVHTQINAQPQRYQQNLFSNDVLSLVLGLPGVYEQVNQLKEQAIKLQEWFDTKAKNTKNFFINRVIGRRVTSYLETANDFIRNAGEVAKFLQKIEFLAHVLVLLPFLIEQKDKDIEELHLQYHQRLPFIYCAALLSVSAIKLREAFNFQDIISNIEFELSDINLDGNFQARLVDSDNQTIQVTSTFKPVPEILISCLFITKAPTNFAYLAFSQLAQAWAHDMLDIDSNPAAYKTYVYQLFKFGLQVGLDFETGAGGILVSAYLGGQILEAVSSRLYDHFDSKARFSNNRDKYPAIVFNKNLWQQAGYFMGAFLGQGIYRNMSDLFLSAPEIELPHSTNPNESTRTATDDASSPHPIKLSEHETSLLNSQRNCDSDFKSCVATARKVLHLNPHQASSQTEIKTMYRQLGLFWHPDKNRAYDINTLQEQMAQINNAFNVLKRS